MTERIAVIGLGYVGLPVALAFARKFPGTVGFDIAERRIAELKAGRDRTDEVAGAEIAAAPIRFTGNVDDLRGASLFVVTVPTPIDANRQPDLGMVTAASETVGRVIGRGGLVVYESTVYPGVTEEICGPIIARASGLRQSRDFKLGYSPERINPGDREHTLERIVKVVSGEDAESLERVAAAYAAIVPAGVHRAPSIKVAEAAKVIENTQRDLNIALMNELSLIFDRMGIRTKDVLDAAATKWNFLRFTPGLVGGHCIGVDPYYLTAKAQTLGYHPEVILAGRRINDNVGAFVAQKLIKLLIAGDHPVRKARVGILGMTFKENIPDIRNTRAVDIVHELRQFDIDPVVHDPLADPEDARAHCGIDLAPLDAVSGLDALVLAVPHRHYLERGTEDLLGRLRPGGVLIDVKSSIDPAAVGERCRYWSL